MSIPVRSALISVYHKQNLEPLIRLLKELNITLYSTGGTLDYIRSFNFDAIPVESVTDYPSILDGRVKTLHPKIFGGILYMRDNEQHNNTIGKYNIPPIDLVIVDLYPFEDTVASGAPEEEIIEKIDIGGISLIRAAAKNFNDVLIVPSSAHYDEAYAILHNGNGTTTLEQRKTFAGYAFQVSSGYDAAIAEYFAAKQKLRYGENPHQEASFRGDLSKVFRQLHGKEISYNNLLDIDAAFQLIGEFSAPTFAIIKHNNACGLASRPSLTDAWRDALAGDPVSAFGGVIITNRPADENTAAEINQLFFEVIIAPDYEKNALPLLQAKKNRIILQSVSFEYPTKQFRSILNGVLEQSRDNRTELPENLQVVTQTAPSAAVVEDLIFANKIVKHSKSNAIVLARNGQMLASGVGQTSRVDALRHAIEKARSFGFDLNDAVMASDAFFPFADSVEIAHAAGVNHVIQPGGSVRDNETIDFCNTHGMSMVFTGNRHFKH